MATESSAMPMACGGGGNENVWVTFCQSKKEGA